MTDRPPPPDNVTVLADYAARRTTRSLVEEARKLRAVRPGSLEWTAVVGSVRDGDPEAIATVLHQISDLLVRYFDLCESLDGIFRAAGGGLHDNRRPPTPPSDPPIPRVALPAEQIARVRAIHTAPGDLVLESRAENTFRLTWTRDIDAATMVRAIGTHFAYCAELELPPLAIDGGGKGLWSINECTNDHLRSLVAFVQTLGGVVLF